MDKESNLERARRLIGKEFNLKPPSMEISIGDINFLNEAHRERFTDYCQRAHIHSGDNERKAFFFIMAGSNDLVSKGIDRMYDFTENTVKFHPAHLGDDFEQFVFCSNSDALCRLALNLYNDSFLSLSVNETFRDLDEDNQLLAIEAIKIRFNIR